MSTSHASIGDVRSTPTGATGRRRARRHRGGPEVAAATTSRAGGTPAGAAPRLPSVVLATFVLLLLLGGTVLAGAASVGVRWFDVRTPSMGTAAPVGTLVVTRPVPIGELRVGDVVSFHPDGDPAQTYTHRIVRVTSTGAGRTLTTRGDVNGAADPWDTTAADLVGRADLLLPGAGWALRGLPLVAAGIAIVGLLGSMVRRPDHRSAFHVLGVSVVVAGVAAFLRPFVGTTLVETTTGTRHPEAVVVSTGLLPTRVALGDGSSVDLISGEVGRLRLPVDHPSLFHLATSIHLSPIGWVVGLAICLLPLAWTTIVGLPSAAHPDAGLPSAAHPGAGRRRRVERSR